MCITIQVYLQVHAVCIMYITCINILTLDNQYVYVIRLTKLQTLLVQLTPNCTASLVSYINHIGSLCFFTYYTFTFSNSNVCEKMSFSREYERRAEWIISASAVGRAEGVANDRSIHKANSLVFSVGTRPQSMWSGTGNMNDALLNLVHQ